MSVGIEELEEYLDEIGYSYNLDDLQKMVDNLSSKERGRLATSFSSERALIRFMGAHYVEEKKESEVQTEINPDILERKGIETLKNLLEM